MPTYDYECRDCGKIHDDMRPIITRKEPSVCPYCAGVSDMVIVNAPVGKVEDDWSTENGGRGRNITQLTKSRKDRAYFKSKNQLHEHCKKLKDNGEIKNFERA